MAMDTDMHNASIVNTGIKTVAQMNIINHRNKINSTPKNTLSKNARKKLARKEQAHLDKIGYVKESLPIDNQNLIRPTQWNNNIDCLTSDEVFHRMHCKQHGKVVDLCDKEEEIRVKESRLFREYTAASMCGKENRYDLEAEYQLARMEENLKDKAELAKAAARADAQVIQRAKDKRAAGVKTEGASIDWNLVEGVANPSNSKAMGYHSANKKVKINKRSKITTGFPTQANFSN